MQVIRSLKRALQPAITNVSVEFKVAKGCEVLQSPQNLPPLFNGEKLVVYGILKSKAATIKKQADAIVILKGNMQGRMQEYTVSFTLDATEALSLPVIHHLAAKALIADWESENKEKKVIVDLSIESSVISSHTAFIAVDEESSEPVSGAMKTYDIGAQMHEDRPPSSIIKLCKSSDQMNCAFYAPRFISRMAPEPVQPAASSSRIGYFLPPRSMPRSCGDGDSLPATPPEVLHHISLHSKCMDSSSQHAASPKPIAEISKHTWLCLPPSQPTDTLTSLITAQQINGSWALNSAFAQLVGKSLSDLKSACPIECKGALANVWATVLAVSLLRARYSSQQDEWELIAMKAESWLKKQSLPSTSCTLKQLFQAARNIAQ